MGSYLNKTLVETDHCTSEQRLWRAVLNQALSDAFEVNTIAICDHEKKDVENFFRVRSKQFDEICDNAGLDPTRLWRKVQRLKGVKAGFIIPLAKEKNVLDLFEGFKKKRERYMSFHWRQHYVG